MSLYCGLLIVWTLIDRLYRDSAGFMYLLDVLVVVVHISHSNCWSTYYCTRIEVSVLRAGRGRRDGGYGGGGGGGGWKFLVTAFLFAKTSSWGLKTQKKKIGGGGGRRKISMFFPYFSKMFLRFWNACKQFFMTMTCDRLKFWSGPAWRSKFIIRKPWRRKNKK